MRLPANVRISKEFVQLLKILLNRKPHSRAGFEAFFQASEAFVALGCNGIPTVTPSIHTQESTDTANDGIPSHPLDSGQKIVDRDVCSQMNLCAISENDGGGESFHQRTGSLATVATLGTVNQQQLQQQARQSTQANAANAMAQVRPGGVVTPPFNPVMAQQPPPALPHGLQGAASRQHGSRPSVFAPLQGSPNLSPSTSAATNPPQLSLANKPGYLPAPRPGPIQGRSQSMPVYQHQQQQQQQQQQRSAGYITQSTQGNNNNRRNTSPHESQSSDSGFVMVEYSGSRSRPGSGQNSPATSQIVGITRSSSNSPRSSSGRVTILDARNNMGMLGTSPGTGRALIGKMMMGSSPTKSSLTPPSTSYSSGGNFNLSPRAALRSGGCLAHIEVLARMLAAAEDVGRRAITVGHLGDVRAFVGMELLVNLKEESQLSSMSTGTPSTSMEGVDDGRNSDTHTGSTSKLLAKEDEDDELPFAMTSSDDNGPDSSSSNKHTNVIKSSSDEKPSRDTISSIIQIRFQEALVCYMKALKMMKVSVSAAQKVMKDVEEVINMPTLPADNTSSGNTMSQNPYTPLKQRCSTIMKWLAGQYDAIMERADAANDQISKLQKGNSSQMETEEILVEELIYNHSMKCGHEGAVKQIGGNYAEARDCFRSAGLLAETLLMNSKLVVEDQAHLDEYVNSFAEQIMTLDRCIALARRGSASMYKQDGSVSPRTRRQSSNVSPALTSL